MSLVVVLVVELVVESVGLVEIVAAVEVGVVGEVESVE